MPTTGPARYPVVELRVSAGELELASADLYDLGTVGIEEVGTEVAGRIHLRAGFPSDDMAITAAAALDARWSPEFLVLEGDDWLDAWREHFEPFRVGRLVIVPAWKDDRDLAGDPVLSSMGLGDIVMHLDPGRSFGTGAHPSTRLVLEALQRRSEWERPDGSGFVGIAGIAVEGTRPESIDAMTLTGMDVLDVGCGSGVLGVAASLLGAGRVDGVDVETVAIETTSANAARNAVSDCCTASQTPIADVSRSYDLVLANILAPVLIELAVPIGGAVRPGGRLMLSGIIETQRDRVVAAFGEAFVMEDELAEEPWVCVVLRRTSTDDAVP